MNSIELKLLSENPKEYVNKITIQNLEDILILCNKKYHSEIPIVSDYVYDTLMEILETKDPTNTLIKGIGFKSNNDKYKLPFYMGSMNKTKTYEGFEKWIHKYSKDCEFLISEKLDGISALLYINNGNINIYTRGNGNYGRNISFLKDYINIPKTIDNIVVRGELIIKKKVFNENRGNYICSRNMVGGLLMCKETNTQLYLLDFIVFELIAPLLLPKDQQTYVSNKGLNFVKNITINYNKLIHYNTEEDFLVLNLLKEFKKKSIYEIDGIIISHNNIYERENNNPKNSIAFKSNNNGKITTIKNIIWSVSKYGVLIPRIQFDKINLGSIVEYCTGFSGKFIFNNCLGPGSKIRIVLSGDVIPYITEIISSTSPDMPKVNYKWNETKVHCLISGIGGDEEYNKKRILHFIKTIKIEHLSSGLINKLYNEGFNTIPKILQITKSDLLKIDGFKQQLSSKIIENIHKVINKEIDIAILMSASLEFDSGFGIKRFNKILDKYPNILDINITFEQIIHIDGFQLKTAKQFIDNLKNFKIFLQTIPFINYKINTNKNIETIETIFTNKNIVLTGFRDEKLLNYIENSGGKIQGSLNKKTNILIVKDKDYKSSKIDAAILLGITILYKEEIKI
jgi:DNA ligase (NAD+)